MSNKNGKMSLTVTRSKQKEIKVSWEPCATSTPMKVVHKNRNSNNNCDRKQQQRGYVEPLVIAEKILRKSTSTNILVKKSTEKKPQFTRITKNLKSSAFFELSSSDESSDENDIRPIIQLNSTKKNNSLFVNKNVENEKNSINSNKDSNTSNLKNKSFKNEIQNNSRVENISSSDERSHLLDKSKPKTTLVNNCVVNQNNSVNKEIHLNNYKTKERKCKNKKFSVYKNNGFACVDFENQKGNLECDDVSKPIKRKNKTTVNEPIKKRKTRKAIDVIPKESIPTSGDNPPIHVSKTKINQSHQLFSDSREQECINSLDLTSVEVNEAKENENASKQNLLPSYTSPHPSIQEELIKTKNIQKRTRKNKQNLLKECLQKNSAKLDNLVDKNVPEVESKETDASAEKINKNIINKKNETNSNGVKKPTRKIGNSINSKTKEEQSTKDAINTDNPKNSLLSCLGSNSETNKISTGEKKEEELLLEKPEFKLLNEMFAEKKEKESSVFECWSINSFKCGVFKLKVKSHIGSKTYHRNSYLGGVLIKGHLKMRICEKVQELTEGDMAFVPPLTEWEATNIADCESVFYYWCGRFNS